MAGNYSITTRAPGTILTASIYNADHQNHVTNHTPQGLDDYSANVTQMRTTTDPGESASESLATSTAGEIERLRFAIFEAKKILDPSLTYWYESPSSSSGYAIANLALSASVATNNLTIAVKDGAGADPSASSSALVPFRDATETTGTIVARTITAALSITVDAGETLGFANSETDEVYVYALDNAGTVELAVSKYGLFDEDRVHDTTVLSASSDLPFTLYSTTARSNVAIKFLGTVRIQHGTAQWSNSPTVVAASQVAVRKPVYIDPINRPILANDAGDADHDIEFGIGMVADSTGKYVLELTSALVKQLDATWAAGTAAGGRATGFTLPATDRSTVHHFLIGKLDGDTVIQVDAGFDDSVTATNLLSDSGYDVYRRVGSTLINATDDFYTFEQYGHKFYIEEHVFTTSLLTGSFADYGTDSPTGLEGLEIIYGWGMSNATGSNVSSSLAYGASDLMELQYGWMPATNGGNFDQTIWPVDSSGNIRMKFNVGGGSAKNHFILGWIDRLDLD